jgi:hypothetical protein
MTKKQINYILIPIQKQKNINIRFISMSSFFYKKKNESITIEQFDFLIKFIEKEKPFRNSKRIQIHNYFSPVITTEEIIASNNSLEKFMI